MILNRDKLYKMILLSISDNTSDWILTDYRICNKGLSIEAWICNGIWFFQFNIESNYKKIRFSVYQTIILHIFYLRKIKKNSYILILLRYLLFSWISPITIFLLYLNTNNNETSKNIDLGKIDDLSNIRRLSREYSLNEILINR